MSSAPGRRQKISPFGMKRGNSPVLLRAPHPARSTGGAGQRRSHIGSPGAMQHIERASAFRIYLRALREVRPFWPHLLAILALALIETPLGLLAPLPMKVILDSVLGGAPPPAWFDPVRLGLAPGALLALAIGLTLVLAALALGHRLGAWF